ncbi:MAG: ABC transporter permease [Actinomycetota bacterium]|nr:ABC transporter permease [Actinomycetota bacterium]
MFLALREIRRARLRFGLLAGAIGLLVFLLLFQLTLLNSLLDAFTGALENQSGEIVVYSEDARLSLEGSLVQPDQLEAVAGVDGVAASGPLGVNTFTVTAGGTQQDAALFGYELDGPGEPTTLTDGRLPERDGEGVAPAADAEDGYAIGDVIELAGGAVTIEIVGVADDIQYSVQPTVFVSWPTYEAASTAVNPNARAVLASVVVAQPAEGRDAAEVAEAIDGAVEGVEAVTRQAAVDESPGVTSVSQSFQVIFLLLYVVVTLVAGFFFLIVTVQKLDALVLLRAVGAPPGYLVRSLLVQVGIVAVAGVLLGVGLAVGVLAGVSAAVPSAELFVIPSFGPTAQAALLVLVLVVAASAVSVRRVLKADPADAVGKATFGGLG